jgi:hypothetical protein
MLSNSGFSGLETGAGDVAGTDSFDLLDTILLTELIEVSEHLIEDLNAVGTIFVEDLVEFEHLAEKNGDRLFLEFLVAFSSHELLIFVLDEIWKEEGQDFSGCTLLDKELGALVVVDSSLLFELVNKGINDEVDCQRDDNV